MPKTMHNGHYVGTFKWTGRKGFEPLERAFGVALDAARKFREAAEAVKADPHLTATGQRGRLLEVAAKEPGMALAAARKARREALEMVQAKRAELAHAGPDKSDLAGALLRQEVRGWLRGLPVSERTAMLMAGDLDPVAALAIAEGPHHLSGVTPEQRQRVLDAAIDAANPNATAELADLEAAAEVVANAESHLARTIADTAGLGPMEVDALAHRSDPPVLREQKTFDGRPQMVLAKDPTAPTGWRPARKAEIASGVYEAAG